MLFYYNGKNNSAIMEIKENKIFLKKGSIVRDKNMPTFEKHRKGYYNKWKDILENHIDENNALIDDIQVNSRSEATTIILGGASPNNDIWKTGEGKTFDEIYNSDVTLEEDDDKLTYLTVFLKDIDVLNILESEIDFNVFETLNVIRKEISHSNVLSWLLNPNETHGLNDSFTKEFLKSVYDNNTHLFNDLSLEDVYLWTYENIEVYRERKNIDILLIDNQKKLIVIIENKIDSSEHGEQLNKYEKYINEEYMSYKKMFIYLTITGEEASKNDIWGSYSYQLILDELLKDMIQKANSKVKNFLIDYESILRRYIVNNDRIEQICRRIYSKHKKALDLIYEYRPDIILEISNHIKDIVKEKETIIIKHSIKNSIRFSDTIMEKINDIYREVADNWVVDKSVVLHEIKINEKTVKISTVVGPTVDDSRNDLINYFKAKGHKTLSNGKKWTTLKTTKIIDFGTEDHFDNILDKIDKVLIDKIEKHTFFIKDIFNNFSS